MIKGKNAQNPAHPYRETSVSDLGEELARLQRELLPQKKSMIIVVEGWESSGRGRIINDLTRELDPRYIQVLSMAPQACAPEDAVPLRRHFKALPAYGESVVLTHSIYDDLFSQKEMEPQDRDRLVKDIRFFEDLLTADGTLVLKFFLHQTQATMAARIAKLQASPDREFLVGPWDQAQLDQYDAYLDHFSRILTVTQRTRLPWHIVSSEDYKDAAQLILGTVIQSLRLHLAYQPPTEAPPMPPRTQDPLAALDLTASLDKDTYKARLRDLQREAGDLIYRFYKENQSIIIAFEGTDAAGKGGTIRRLTRLMDPRSYHISTTAAPDQRENAFHYLWRFYRDFPRKGHMTIFDRSWYGRVLVERVEGLTPARRWQEAYEEIRIMESRLVDDGVLLLKYLLVIDKDEQKDRFEDRAEDPDKAHKLTDEDWRNHEKFAENLEAMKDMIAQTHTKIAPWTIVSSQDKRHARIFVLEHFIQAAKAHLAAQTES